MSEIRKLIRAALSIALKASIAPGIILLLASIYPRQSVRLLAAMLFAIVFVSAALAFPVATLLLPQQKRSSTRALTGALSTLIVVISFSLSAAVELWRTGGSRYPLEAGSILHFGLFLSVCGCVLLLPFTKAWGRLMNEDA
jgi:hypothetical protein